MKTADTNTSKKSAQGAGEAWPPERPESAQDEPALNAPTSAAAALSASFATRLWLDHFTSHRIPVAPRSGPRFDSADSAVAKMLLDEAEITPVAMSPVEIPPVSDTPEADLVKPDWQEWLDELPPISARGNGHLAQVVTDSPKEQGNVPPRLQALIATDPAGFADAVGLSFAAFVTHLGE